MMRFRPHALEPHKTTARVALAYKSTALDRNVSHVGLGVTALNALRTLQAHGYWAEVWPAADAADLERLLARAQDDARVRHAHPVTHVVIAALWMPTAALSGMAMRYPEVHFTVESHSNIGFLQADPNAVRLLREALDVSIAQHNVSVAGNCHRFVTAFAAMYGRPLICLPNLYDVSTIRHVGHRVPWHPGSTLRIGVFGATRVLKNMVSAVAACVELAAETRADVEVHMNVGRDEHAGTTRSAITQLLARLPNCRLVEVGWKTWPEFRSHVRQMALLMQPSYTESFNNVTADGAAEGVASVVSDAIDWAPRDWVSPADDVASIARTARRLLHDVHAAEDGQAALRRHVEHGMKEWRHYLDGDR